MNSKEIQKIEEESLRHDAIFKGLADLTAAVRNLESSFLAIQEELKAEREKIAPLFELISNGKFTFKVVAGCLTGLMFLGGLYLEVIKIIHAQNQ